MLTEHRPRLWLTPERLARIQSCCAEKTVRWTCLQEVAEAAVSGTDATYEHIPALAVAYLATGDTRYSQKALEIVLDLAVPENDLTEDQYYFYRDALPCASMALDWLRDQMTATERAQVARWLMDRADQCWPETNPARSEAWAIDNPSNNYYSGYLMTWVAALACTGEDQRAERHLDLAVSRYRNQVRPFLQGWGKGGVFAESTNYDSTFRYALILEGHYTATGKDFLNDPECTFFRDSLYWRIHSTTPAGNSCYPLGDQPRSSDAALSEFDRLRALVVMDSTKDAEAAAFAHRWLDTIDPDTSTHWFAIPWEVLFYQEGARFNSSADLPNWYFAPGPGLLVRRSSWTPDATYWGIWAGPYRESHQNADVNGFLIYKGGWLVGNATIWSYQGICSDTICQNNITIGGIGQEGQTPDKEFPDEAGKVLKVEAGSDYTLFEGDGAQAYTIDRDHEAQHPVWGYVRKFVSLGEDQNLFMVYDCVVTQDPSAPREWHIHTDSEISVLGRGYWFDNGHYRLYGQALLPDDSVTIASVPEMFGYPEGTESSTRLDVTVTSPDGILNVMQIGKVDGPEFPDAVAIKSENGSMEGALCGGWVVLFGTTEQVSGGVIYSFDAPVPTEHLLVDMQPDHIYRVAIKTWAGADEMLVATSTGEGCLRFRAPAGLVRVVVYPL